MTIVAHYALGDVFCFGFRYTIAGLDIYLGECILSIASIVVAAAICCRTRFAGRAQTVLALLFALGILACFVAACFRHAGGLQTLAPAFASDGTPILSQIMRLVAFSP